MISTQRKAAFCKINAFHCIIFSARSLTFTQLQWRSHKRLHFVMETLTVDQVGGLAAVERGGTCCMLMNLKWSRFGFSEFMLQTGIIPVP